MTSRSPLPLPVPRLAGAGATVGASLLSALVFLRTDPTYGWEWFGTWIAAVAGTSVVAALTVRAGWCVPLSVVPFAVAVTGPLSEDDALWAVAWVLFVGAAALTSGAVLGAVLLVSGAERARARG